MANKIRKLTRYIVWCGAQLNYRTFGEDGDTGKILLCLIYFFLYFNMHAFVQVLAIGHHDTTEVLGIDLTSLIKLIFIAAGALIYYLVHRSFKNFKVLRNAEFGHISTKKRRIHTAFIFLFLIFEFYVLLVIMSPSFNP